MKWLLAALSAVAAYLIYQQYQGGSLGSAASDIDSEITDDFSSLVATVTGKLTSQEIAVYAANAGFTDSDLMTAVAIALAESSGNPQAYNPEIAAGTPAGKGSYGLWQIYLKEHPEYAGQNLYDPQTNANAAYAIYQTFGFSPWSTFKGGQYLAQLTSAQAGVAANG